MHRLSKSPPSPTHIHTPFPSSPPPYHSPLYLSTNQISPTPLLGKQHRPQAHLRIPSPLPTAPSRRDSRSRGDGQDGHDIAVSWSGGGSRAAHRQDRGRGVCEPDEEVETRGVGCFGSGCDDGEFDVVVEQFWVWGGKGGYLGAGIMCGLLRVYL